jgi:hypothetical protein
MLDPMLAGLNSEDWELETMKKGDQHHVIRFVAQLVERFIYGERVSRRSVF